MDKYLDEARKAEDEARAASAAAAAHEAVTKAKATAETGTRANGGDLNFGARDDCAICLSAMSGPKKLHCGHWYCSECIEVRCQPKANQFVLVQTQTYLVNMPCFSFLTFGFTHLRGTAVSRGRGRAL